MIGESPTPAVEVPKMRADRRTMSIINRLASQRANAYFGVCRQELLYALELARRDGNTAQLVKCWAVQIEPAPPAL